MANMEFPQQEWINNGNFMSLGSERDPNVGLQEDGATFTIPREPVRRRIHRIETFNVLRGELRLDARQSDIIPEYPY